MKKINVGIKDNGIKFFSDIIFKFENGQEYVCSSIDAFHCLMNLSTDGQIDDKLKSLMIEQDIKEDELVKAIVEGLGLEVGLRKNEFFKEYL